MAQHNVVALRSNLDCFFFNDTATTDIYTLSLHDALPISTLTSGPRNEMNPLERVALYATAIQTGLRSAELRSLTKADLFLASEKPYVRCRADDTKNGQEARQYVQAELATELRRIVSTKTPTAP